jgi:hypothetical protein
LLKGQDTEAFYAKEVRSAMRLSPSSLGRYLYELERMGYIKIARGNRYKGFEYKMQNWNDLEKMQDNAQNMVKEILENIRALPAGQAGVTRNPPVTHNTNGLHKAQKISKKQAVTQAE